MTEYDSPIWDIPPPYLCPTPHPGLSLALKQNDYEEFIKAFGFELRRSGTVDIEHITLVCEGQCPNGCQKKFQLHLGKSITKKSFEKIYKHGEKYPQHCLVTRYTGIVKNNG